MERKGVVFPVKILMVMALLVALSAGLVLAAPVGAVGEPNTHYVSTTGSDEGDGSPSSPWATIGYAISQAFSGDTINVAAGIYNERITINKPLTLLGATHDINKNGYAVPEGYAWDDTVESIIVHPDPSAGYDSVVDVYDVDGITFAGFVVQELSAEANKNISLVRVRAQSSNISITITNNIIGPSTNTTAQDGTHGRMGLYLINNPYSDEFGIVNSTISGNKIFGCEGNGNNIFIWSSYKSYGALGPASMAGTVIEDNEIYGAHRSGIETAGGFSNLTIRNNQIYGNGGPGIVGKPDLMFGNGILMIRGSGDREDVDGYGPFDVTIEGNDIHNNYGHGIYMGPNNTGIGITANVIRDNGKSGIMVDLIGNYWNPDFETYTGPYTNLAGSQDITSQDNDIHGNADNGVAVNGEPTNGFVLDATGNWWGSADSADIASMVSGDVDYSPWMGNTPGTTPMTWYTNDSIQEAIDAATAGDTINVAAGTYTGAIVNKDVTIQGSPDKPVINDGPNTHPFLRGGFVFADDYSGNGVTISGFRFEGSPQYNQTDDGKLDFGVFSRGADNVIIENNVFLNTLQAVTNWHGSGWQITENEITNLWTLSGGGIGILVGANNGSTIENNVISNNVITGTLSVCPDDCGEYDGTGIVLYADFRWGRSGGTVTVTSITGNEISMVSDTPALVNFNGIELTDTRGDDNNLTIYDNEISGNDVYGNSKDGIAVSGGTDNNTINYNRIIDNGQYSLNYLGTGTLDASLNWWGSANGPAHADNTYNTGAQGDTVSDNVLYVPWLDAAPPAGVSFAPVTNTTQTLYYSSIQEAIDAATAGDTLNVAAGTYDESVTINQNNLTIEGDSDSRPSITGGLIFDTDLTGLNFENFYLTGNATGENSIVRMYGAITDLTIDNCIFDGGDIANRMGFSGGQIEGDLTITNSEFKNIPGWAVLDTKSGSGGDGSTMGTVTFAYNSIHDCNGSIAFRGLSTDWTDNVYIYNNTFQNIGEARVSDHWAAFEVNRAGNVSIHDNEIRNVVEGSSGEGQAMQLWKVDTVEIYNNTIENNYMGIAFLKWPTNETYAVSNISIHDNNFSGNAQYALSVESGLDGGPLNAIDNWWGSANGPTHASNPGGTGDAVSGDVDYDPWHLKLLAVPATINSDSTTSAIISWTAEGTWEGDYYDFRYSTSPIDDSNWGAATRITGEPVPTEGVQQEMIVRGLESGTTYHFGLVIADGTNRSDISTIEVTTAAVAVPDTVAPDAIGNLAAGAGSPATTSIILNWTATGDDGASGFTAKYIIKRSTAEINAENFDAAITVYNTLIPKAGGQTETFTVTNLSPGTTYYFAIKVQDEVPNTSAISNVVTINTAANLPTVTGIYPDPSGDDNSIARQLSFVGSNLDAGTPVVRLVSSTNVINLINVNVLGPTQILATIPKGAPAGTYKARVINDNGTSALGGTYEVKEAPQPLPVVTNVSPNMATSNTGVDNVKISGENFNGATDVTVNGTQATNLSIVSNNRIWVTMPALPAGEYDVKVTTAAGTNEVSAVKYIATEPVKIDENSTEDTTTSSVVTTTGTIPVQLTLTTDNSETATQNTDADAEISVVIPPQTNVTSGGTTYSGVINPPRVVKPDEEAGLPETAIVIEMGNPEQTINFSQDFVTTVRVEADEEPDIYYLNKDTGQYELAGKTGTLDGINYVPGGTVLNVEDSIYTIGLLMDHMSTYVASAENLLPAPAPQPFTPAPVPEPEPKLPPGTTDVSGIISNEGIFTSTLSIVSTDGTIVLEIPAGTAGLTKDLEPLNEITIEASEDVPAAPEGTYIIGITWELGPDGAIFEPAINLIWPYDPAALPEGVTEDSLTIAWYDEAADEWIMLESTVDTVSMKVTASISHFSVFGLFGSIPAEPEPTEPAPEEPRETAAEPTETAPKPTQPAPEPTEPIKPAPVPTETTPEPTETAAAPAEPVAFPWYWWIVIAAGAVLLLTLGILAWQRRRD